MLWMNRRKEMDIQYTKSNGDRSGLGMSAGLLLHLLRGDEEKLLMRRRRGKCIVLEEIIPAKFLRFDTRNLC